MPDATNTGPGYPERYQPATGRLNTIINNGVSTGCDKWGFVILRGVYDNDDEWNTFLDLYKAEVADELHEFGLQDRLGQHLEWTVIEDRAVLEGASKAAARARFLTWVEQQKRDGEIADRPWAAKYLPRYKFCFYVDDTCIKTIVARQHGGKSIGYQWCLGSAGCVVIINGLHQEYEPQAGEEDEEEDDEGYMEVDGSTSYDVGWAYIDVLGYSELYSNLGSGGSPDEIWIGMVYRGRRPEKRPEPDYNSGRPLSEVERGVPYGQQIQK